MEQKLTQLIKANQEEILTQWFHQLIDAYPPQAAKHFKNIKNEFANPVGSNIHLSLKDILDELVHDADADKLYKHLEKILMIKAVQDVTPAMSTAFLFSLKNIIEKKFAREIANGEIKVQELLEFYSQLDSLSLLAFNIYSDRKEKIYLMRIAQIKQTNDLLQKANLLNEAVDTCTLMRCSNYKEPQEGEIL